MKEIMYSSIESLRELANIFYVDDGLLKIARKFLENKRFEYVKGERHYYFGECMIIDFNALGLRICYDDETKFNSLVEKLFPKK